MSKHPSYTGHSRNNLGETPLHRAIIDCGSSNLVSLLLQNGANPLLHDHNQNTALHLACYGYTSKHCRMVRLMLQSHPESINSRDHDRMTPFHICTKRCDLPLTKLMLEHGPAVDAQNNEGSTALHLACQSGIPKMVKLILPYSQRIHVRQSNGWVPVHNACSVGRVELVELVLK